MATPVKTTSSTDKKILALIEDINRQKRDIAAAEKSEWKTNQAFPYQEGSANVVQLNVERDVGKLVKIASFLRATENAYNDTARALGVDAPAFTWSGYSIHDWLSDLKNRINRLQIDSKRKKLESLDQRLNSLVSPELRARLELEAIESELSGL